MVPLTTTGRPSSSPTATAVTSPVWPVNGSPTALPVPRSHHPHRAINGPADHHRAAVQLADGHRRNLAGVAGERAADRVTGAQVAHPHRGIVATADHHRAAVQ